MEIKELTTFSCLEYHSSKCGSNLQTFEHDVLENLGLQISGISRQQTPSLIRSKAFTFAPGFLANFTIHTICGYIIAAGQITHRIPAIRNWNFLICWFKSVWLHSQIFQSQSFFQFLTHCQILQHTGIIITWTCRNAN